MESNRRILSWTIIASQFAPPFMFSGVAVALPEMGAKLHAGATSLGLVETLFLGGSVAFLLPIGKLADATDKRTLYKLGLLAFGLMSILIACLSWVPGILAIRFFQGITSAIFGATALAIVAEIAPPEERGRAFGRSIGVAYSGLMLGPIAAGLLIDAFGWRAVFIAGSVPLLITCAVVQRMMPSAWKKPGPNLMHAPSAILATVAPMCWIAGSATLREGPIGFTLLAIGFILAAIFVVLQRRLEKPLLDVRALMIDGELKSALLVQLLLYMNAYCSIFMLSIYLQVTLAVAAKTSGQIIASGTLLMAVTAPISGVLTDRYRPRTIATIGVAFIGIAVALALTLDAATNPYFVIVILAAQGLGFALFSSPNMTIIMNSVPASQGSMASALGAKSRSLGMVFGMLVVALLISIDLGNDPIAKNPLRFVGTMRAAFTVLAVTTAMAMFTSLLVRAPYKRT